VIDNHTARAMHVTFSYVCVCTSVVVNMYDQKHITDIHFNKICCQNFIRPIRFKVFEPVIWKFGFIFSRWRVLY